MLDRLLTGVFRAAALFWPPLGQAGLTSTGELEKWLAEATRALEAEAPDTGTTRGDLREIQEAARPRPLADTSHMLARLIGEGVRLELRAATVA